MESYPADWVRWLDPPMGKVEVLSTDLSAVSAEADQVVRVTGSHKNGNAFAYLLHIEFQSGRDEDMAGRLARYSILLWYRYRLPVISAVVLLRRAAETKGLNGTLRLAEPEGDAYLNFRYRIVRVWEQLPEDILQGGLGTLPFAPLAKAAKKDLPDIVRQTKSRFDSETTQANAGRLWTSSFIMMGLRYEEAFIDRLLEGAVAMKESVTYQKILREGRAEGIELGRGEGIELGREEGREEEAKRIIFRLGTKRFGEAGANVVAHIEAAALPQLELLVDRLIVVESWDELLQ